MKVEGDLTIVIQEIRLAYVSGKWAFEVSYKTQLEVGDQIFEDRGWKKVPLAADSIPAVEKLKRQIEEALLHHVMGTPGQDSDDIPHTWYEEVGDE